MLGNKILTYDPGPSMLTTIDSPIGADLMLFLACLGPKSRGVLAQHCRVR